jgi:hypothetical protein
MRGFQNVLQILSQTIGCDYSSYYNEVRAELYKLYNKYENKFGAVRSQRNSQAAGSTSKKKWLGVRSLVVLHLHLHLLLLHLPLLLHLFLSCLLNWTVTLSHALMMSLTL